MQFKAYLIGFGVALAALAGVYGMVWFSRDGAHEFRGERLRFAAEVPLAVLPDAGVEKLPRPQDEKGGGRAVKRKTQASPRPNNNGAQMSVPASSVGEPLSPRVLVTQTERTQEPAVPVRESCAFVTSEMPRRTRIILNEVAWMGNVLSPNGEWIEFKNVSSSAVDLTGWQFVDQGEQIRVIFDGADVVAAGGFYLLERSSDDAAPAVAAHGVYSGALANEGEGIRLFAPDCGLEDEVFANLDWPGGENESKRTMERDHSWFGWHTASVIGGTPGAENSPPYMKPQAPPPQPPPSTSAPIPSPTPQPTGGPSPTPTPSATPTPTGTPVSSPQPSPASNANHVLISEIQTGTDSGGAEDEFVELYNPTNEVMNLAGWSLKKRASSGNLYNLVSSSAFTGTIFPRSFFLIAHNNYQGSVVADRVYSANSNNLAYPSNAVVLYDAGGNVVDEVSWDEIAVGTSWERKAYQNGMCIFVYGAGETLGNGCDTDSGSDFEPRATPNPQNTQNAPEPL